MTQDAPERRPLHCLCCGRVFSRRSRRGTKPLYCSPDCRAQMRVRFQVWERAGAAFPAPPIEAAPEGPVEARL